MNHAELYCKSVGMGRNARKHKLQIRKKRSWSKILLSVVALFACLILIICIGLWFAITSYLSGDDFKSFIEKRAAREMKVDVVSLSPLEWGGSSLTTKSMKAQGGETIQKLEISNLEAEVNRPAILDRHFEVSNIHADSVSIHLVKPDHSKPAIPEPTDGEPLPLPSKENSSESLTNESDPATKKISHSPNWWKEHILPTKYSLNKASINKINLIYEDGQKAYSLNNVKLTITPEPNNQEYRILLQGGEFSLPHELASKGTIQSALLRYRPDRVSASDFRITLDNGGYLDIEGEYSVPEKSWWTSIVVRDIKCADLLPQDWKQKIEGVVQGTARVKKEIGMSPEASGSVKIDKGVLTALPILDTMAAFTGTSKFRRIQFNNIEANYNYQDETIHIKDIVLSSEGLLRVEGNITIDKDKTLRGQLKIGMLPGILSNIPGAEEKIFLSENNQGKMGLLWANVNLSGTTDHPREDLSARLITAAGERLFGSLPGQAEKALLFSGNLAEKLLGGKKSSANDQEATPPDQKDQPDTQEPIKKPVEKTINRLIEASKLFGL